MAKLALTGGGRCNITNTFEFTASMQEVYPRGTVFMKRALAEFPPSALLEWFEKRGVSFVTEDEGRVFPASGDAMQIVNTLLDSLEGVEIRCRTRLAELPESDIVIVTTGGGSGMEILRGLPVETVPPVPSLFTFNISDTPSGGRSELGSLMGISAEASLLIPGTKFRSEGSLLITDWGLSGPAALRLSSYSARHLAECGYHSPLSVRWCENPEDALGALREDNPYKMLKSVHPEGIASRLWEYLLHRSGADPLMPWAEAGRRTLNRLASVLLGDVYYINGKTRFRDEFVTCGGVSLSSLNPATLESRERPGLYFAGEVLDVDAVTGGYNLQAAWSSAYLVAKSIIKQYDT